MLFGNGVKALQKSELHRASADATQLKLGKQYWGVFMTRGKKGCFSWLTTDLQSVGSGYRLKINGEVPLAASDGQNKVIISSTSIFSSSSYLETFKFDLHYLSASLKVRNIPGRIGKLSAKVKSEALEKEFTLDQPGIPYLQEMEGDKFALRSAGKSSTSSFPNLTDSQIKELIGIEVQEVEESSLIECKPENLEGLPLTDIVSGVSPQIRDLLMKTLLNN